MARHDPTELAKVAFAAYCGATGGKNHRGEEIPAWENLGPAVRTAWEVSAEAVARKVLRLAAAPGQKESR
ncbi:hypothetical protein ABZX77_30595 [Streptomyces sp. NPDC004237]|uniref:hypothetical protein n=1 Tax=Streptomyces sp. NPDC004237 TaxID=3154455 RepID=UPI0033B4622B